MTTRRAAAVFDLENNESTTISEKTLCELQDCEAQECAARDLQKPAAQAAPGMIAGGIRVLNYAKITRS
jgi:hypothetical protein